MTERRTPYGGHLPPAPARAEVADPRYQVGSLFAFDLQDPEFSTLDEAMAHAMKAGDTMGIWTSQDMGSELLYIIYQGEVFRK